MVPDAGRRTGPLRERSLLPQRERCPRQSLVRHHPLARAILHRGRDFPPGFGQGLTRIRLGPRSRLAQRRPGRTGRSAYQPTSLRVPADLEPCHLCHGGSGISEQTSGDRKVRGLRPAEIFQDKDPLSLFGVPPFAFLPASLPDTKKVKSKWDPSIYFLGIVLRMRIVADGRRAERTACPRRPKQEAGRDDEETLQRSPAKHYGQCRAHARFPVADIPARSTFKKHHSGKS